MIYDAHLNCTLLPQILSVHVAFSSTAQLDNISGASFENLYKKTLTLYHSFSPFFSVSLPPSISLFLQQQQRREREMRKQQEREQRRRYEEMEQLRRDEERRHAEREQVHTLTSS